MSPDTKIQSSWQLVLILCVTDLNWLLAGTSTATYGDLKDSTVYTSEQKTAVAKQVLIVRVTGLNWLLTGPHSTVKSRIKGHSKYSTVFTRKLPHSICFHVVTPLRHIFRELTHLIFNAYMLYLLGIYLTIFSVGMTCCVYCGIQDRCFMCRFLEGLIFFMSPKYPDLPWTRPASL
jgi:hypothetical protein